MDISNKIFKDGCIVFGISCYVIQIRVSFKLYKLYTLILIFHNYSKREIYSRAYCIRESSECRLNERRANRSDVTGMQRLLISISDDNNVRGNNKLHLPFKVSSKYVF